MLTIFEKTYNMKIAIGNDHAGTEYKNAIVDLLNTKGFEVINFGTDGIESVDYPDFIHPVANAVNNGVVDFGIILCGSGNGANMTANKYKNVRSALCWNSEITLLAREHNDANILSIPARYTSEVQVLDMVELFINTPFQGGRHLTRVKKIPCS